MEGFFSAAALAVAPLALQSNPDDGLTLSEVFQSIPTDPASLVAYLLVAGFVGGVIWFGTRSGGSAGKPEADRE